MIVGALVMMALAQAPASPATLSGQVVDAEGRPVAGVEVLLSGFRRGTCASTALARATSEQDGPFRIDIPAETDSRQANYSYLAVWAYDPKVGLAGQSFARSAPPAAGSVGLKLGGPVHVAIRVVGPDGKPVAGARVAPAWLRPDGKPVAGGSAQVIVLAARFARRPARGHDRRRRQGTDPGLSSRGYRSGADRSRRVRSPGKRARRGGRGRPDDRSAGRGPCDRPHSGRQSGRGAGLDVIALTLPQGSAGPQTTGQGSATIDAEGRFVIPALAAGKLHVNVLPSEGTKLRPRSALRPRDRAGQDRRGHDPDGGPPARADRDGPGRRSHRPARCRRHRVPVGRFPARTEATTGTDGRFALSGVVARPTFLFVRKPGYRFLGLAIAAGSNDVTLTIHTEQEPPRLLRRTLPPPLPRQEESALARHLLDPYAERALKQGASRRRCARSKPWPASSPSACWS